MNRFLQFLGLLTLIAGILYGTNYLYQNHTNILTPIFFWLGVATAAAGIIYGVLRLVYGKNWLFKTGANTVLGPGLIESGKQLIEEVQHQKVKNETVSKVGAHIIWRLTRLGLFAILIALIPFILLFQQNRLIKKQNDLFTYQNERIDKQTHLLSTQNEKLESQNKLFEEQNAKVDTQTTLLGKQTKLFEGQNERIDKEILLMGTQTDLLIGQNARIDTQNLRINIQNNLIEADRRSSLVFLMSNVLDKVDEEIKNRRIRLDSQGIKPYEMEFPLSEPLISRIVALSRAFRPYKELDGDSLSMKLVSPERGQLFVALMENNLDSFTQNTIIKSGDFSYAIVGEISKDNRKFAFAKLNGANLSGSSINFSNFKEAELQKADLSFTSLRFANLKGANLKQATLYNANLNNSNLGYEHYYTPPLNDRDDELVEFYINTNLSQTNLINATLEEADLSGVDLSGANFLWASLYRADLREADLSEAKNLSKKQLIETISLYDCIGLDPTLKIQLQKERPCLFTEEGCPTE